jgi:hypothetical protein
MAPQTAFLLVDKRRQFTPSLERDRYWEEQIEVPYTEASLGVMDRPMETSATNVQYALLSLLI